MDHPEQRRLRFLQRVRRGKRRRWVLSVAWLLLVTLLVVGPFAVAGSTGNPLWIAAPVIATLVYVVARESRLCLAYYRSLWPSAWLPALLMAILALACTVSVGLLESPLPAGTPLDWSLGSLFHVGGDSGMNGFAIPLTNPWFAAAYTPAALLSLPLLAWWEEEVFRRGTRGLRSALSRSILFGLIHLSAGVSLGGCLALGCAGGVFTVVYLRALRDPSAAARRRDLPGWARMRVLPAEAGRVAAEQYAVFRATQVHLLYNVIGVCAILFLATR